MQYTITPLVLIATVTATLGGAAHLYLGGVDGQTTGRVATALGVEGQPIAGGGGPDEGADDVGFDLGAAADMVPGVSAGSVLSLVPGLPGIPRMSRRGDGPFGPLPVASRDRKPQDRGFAPGGSSRGIDDGPGRSCRGPACGGGDAKCFAGDTLVTTASGPVAIEAVEPGDLVLTQAAPDQPLVERAVTAVYETPGAPILEIWIGEDGGAVELIEVTPGHPFWVEPAGWIDSDRLAPGDRLHTADGDVASVLSVASTARRETVYNLQVAEHHTYFVGSAETWVHNAGCDDGAYEPGSSKPSSSKPRKRKRAGDGDDGGEPKQRKKADPAEKSRRQREDKEAIDAAADSMTADQSAANVNKQLHDLVPVPGKTSPDGKQLREQKGTTTATLTATVDGKKIMIVGTSSDCLNGRQSRALAEARRRGVPIEATPGLTKEMASDDSNPIRQGEKMKTRAGRCNNPNTGSTVNPHHAEMRALYSLCQKLVKNPAYRDRPVCDFVDEIACDKAACPHCSRSLNQMSLLDKYDSEHKVGGRSSRPDGSAPGHMTVAECAKPRPGL